MRYRADNLRNSYLFFYTSLFLLIFILRISDYFEQLRATQSGKKFIKNSYLYT